MAVLPRTIYNELRKKQRELFTQESRPFLRMDDIYEVFDKYAYKRSTCHKWLLNWAVCLQLKFEEDKEGYKVYLGDFHDLGYTPNDMLCGGKVWLPCKEVWIKTSRGPICVMR